MLDKERPDREYDEIPPCMIFVDKEGNWFHNGAPIIHRQLIAHFYKSLDMDEDGRYVIKFENQVCYLDVEDTPFVIVRTDFEPASSHEEERFVLTFTDDSEENLDPHTLSIGHGDVLYCKVRSGKFKARFSRPAYYQLAQYFQEASETGGFFLRLNRKEYYLEVVD